MIANYWNVSLGERKGRRVRILSPQRGEKRDMIDLVGKREARFEQRFPRAQARYKRVLEDMQETLELPRFPARIESFDGRISRAPKMSRAWLCARTVDESQ